MEWDRSLETGNEAVDEQHRRLMSMFNEVDAAERQSEPGDVRAILEGLTEYVAVHFAMELDLMREIGYPAPDVQAHLSEHRALTERTREMVLAYHAGTTPSVSTLTGFLREWLVHHVAEVDRLLVEFSERRTA